MRMCCISKFLTAIKYTGNKVLGFVAFIGGRVLVSV